MYRFKRINKTKMYQLVKEFAGIRELPPIRQCQFGYYSRTDTCYLCFKEGPAPFKAVYDHWGSRVCLLVSQQPDPDPLSPERNEEIPLNLHWLHEHGFLDKDPVKPAGEGAEMWHAMDELPDKSRPFLVRFIDGTIAFESFSVKHSCFMTNKEIVFWTDDFVAPDNDCMDCPKAHWQSHFGVMCYTCDTVYCTAVEPDDPFC